MKKWLIAGAAGLIALIAVTGGTLALMDGSDPPQGQTRSEAGDDDASAFCADPPCDDVSGGGAAGICLEGAIDCDDTIEEPVDDDVCIQIYPTPPECAGPDEPVSNEPPITIIDGQDPNVCNLVHNITACEDAAAALAIEDLSLRLGSPQAITVQSIEFVQWPDSCLGISKTDVACAEVITPGFRVVLAVGEQTFEYHTDTGTRAELVE